jgi:hyperosmotically inducible periplasmic protein
METAASLPGVKRVDNQLVVQDAQIAGSPDALVRERVRLELWYHRNLSAAHPGIEVNNGVVTVRGQASSQAQIDLITEYIKDVDGVHEVKNDMVVANSGKTMGEKIDDMSATRRRRLHHGPGQGDLALSPLNQRTQYQGRDGRWHGQPEWHSQK